MIDVPRGTAERVVEIETLIFKHGALQRVIEKCEEERRENPHMPELHMDYLPGYKERARSGFWEIVEKCASLKDVLKTENPS